MLFWVNCYIIANKFVDCAIASGADYIVTNDAHYRILEQISFPKVGTLSIKDFCELLYMGGSSKDESTLVNEEQVPYLTKED